MSQNAMNAPRRVVFGAVLIACVACGSGVGGTGGGGGSSGPTVKTLNPGADHSFDSPRFSPDGLRLAVNYRDTNSDTLATFPIADPSQLTVLADAGTYLASPAWATDGRKIYFSDKDGISSVPTAGGAVTAVSRAFNTFAAMDLEVSRDDSRLCWKVNGGGIFTLALGSPGATPQTSVVSGAAVRLSPDGQRLAFVADDRFKVSLLDGGQLADLGVAGSYLSSVAWFENGAQLAVTSKEGVELIPVAADAGRRLLRSEFAATSIDVSRDGKQIVYRVNGQSGLELLTGF